MNTTTTPTTESVKETTPDGNFQIIPADADIAPETRISIEHGFGQYFDKARSLIAQTGGITSPKMAKPARLEFKALRVAAEKERVRLKAESLRFGKAVDGANAILLAAIVPHEERLEEIEKADERRIAQEIATRGERRRQQLEPFGVTLYTVDALGRMDDGDFITLLKDADELHTAKIERERKEAADLLAKQVEEAKERERIRLDNERLLREAQEREEAARVEAARVEAERLANEAKHAQELAEAARVAQAEKDAAAAKAAKERAAIEAKAKKEREESARVARELLLKAQEAEEATRREREAREAEQKAAREAEEKRLADEARKVREAEEAAEKAAQAPDREKLIALADAILALNVPTVKSAKAKKIVNGIVADIQDAAETLRQQAEKL